MMRDRWQNTVATLPVKCLICAKASQLTALILAAALMVSLAGPTLQAGVQSQVEEVVRAAALKNTDVSIMAVDLATGEELLRLDADRPMTPASNMKLVTTAAALSVLGVDFVFRTELQMLMPTDWQKTQGKVVSEYPDLVIKGDGDPAFGDPKLLKRGNLDVEKLINIWVQAVTSRNVTHVNRLFVDDRIFDREYVHPDWPRDQLNERYCAQVSGITFHNNCIELYPTPTRLNESPRVRMSPVARFISTLNRAKTDKTDTFGVTRKPGSNNLTYSGKVHRSRQTPVMITIDTPPTFLGQLLAERLIEAGVGVSEIVLPAEDQVIPQGTLIHAVQTTMPLILQRTNKDSQNLFAECLLKRMGHQQTGAPGSWHNGAAALRIFLRDKLGARAAAFHIADGSGLSSENRVTSHLLVDLLTAVNEDPELSVPFRESLSIGGVDGTLRKRPTYPITGKLLGKSGYIDSVSALSGYLVYDDPTRPSGERVIAFSMLFNGFQPPIYNHQIKRVQDRVLNLLDSEVAPRVSQEVQAQVGGG